MYGDETSAAYTAAGEISSELGFPSSSKGWFEI